MEIEKSVTFDEIKKVLKIENKNILEIRGNNKLFKLGCNIRITDIETDNKLQKIEIRENVKWTDGTCRPGFSNIKDVSIYLDARIVNEDRDFINVIMFNESR